MSTPRKQKDCERPLPAKTSFRGFIDFRDSMLRLSSELMCIGQVGIGTKIKIALKRHGVDSSVPSAPDREAGNENS